MPTVVNRHHYPDHQGPKGSIYIGRGTPLGNPYTLKDHGVAALDLYRRHLWAAMKREDAAVMAALAEIGCDTLLVCSCKPRPCHGDVVVAAWTWLRSRG